MLAKGGNAFQCFRVRGPSFQEQQTSWWGQDPCSFAGKPSLRHATSTPQHTHAQNGQGLQHSSALGKGQCRWWRETQAVPGRKASAHCGDGEGTLSQSCAPREKCPLLFLTQLSLRLRARVGNHYCSRRSLWLTGGWPPFIKSRLCRLYSAPFHNSQCVAFSLQIFHARKIKGILLTHPSIILIFTLIKIVTHRVNTRFRDAKCLP